MCFGKKPAGKLNRYTGMILHQFPDLQWLKQQAGQNFASRKAWGGGLLPTGGWPSVILNTKTAQTYRDNIRGPLSLFTNLNGISEVKTGSRSAHIQPGCFYLTNPDQHYTLEVNHTPGTEVLNIHFGEHWMEQALLSLAKAGTLLDAPFFIAHQRLEFYNRIAYRDPSLTRLLTDAATAPDALAEEERLYSILVHLLHQQQILKRSELALPVVRKSTREEIMKRLLASTDLIYTRYATDLSLDQLAAESCFSKFHFLRLFTLAFGKTPHQFVMELRMARAIELLKDPALEVAFIAKAIGFKDASAFSRQFKKNTGYYPTRYRQVC
jgi:AraC family transcriptional regulator